MNWTPTEYHMNGTPRRTVIEELTEAVHHLNHVHARLRATHPHARDDGDQRRQDTYREVEEGLNLLLRMFSLELAHAANAPGVD